MKGTMPVSFVGKFASGGGTIRTRLLDPGCGVMTSPKPAHETIPNWPPSNWNGGRDQIGIGGRLRWNLHVGDLAVEPAQDAVPVALDGVRRIDDRPEPAV